MRGLLIAVLALACSKPPPPAPSRPAPAAAHEAPAEEVAPETPAPPEPAPPPAEQVAAAVDAGAATPTSGNGEVTVGESREDFLSRLGPCAKRVFRLEASTHPAEVFEPQTGDCVKRFGERQFFVVGDRVSRIQEGLSHYIPPTDPGGNAAR